MGSNTEHNIYAFSICKVKIDSFDFYNYETAKLFVDRLSITQSFIALGIKRHLFHSTKISYYTFLSNAK